MRGFAGIIRLDGGPVAEGEVRHMLDAMNVGPAERVACRCQGSVGLAHLITAEVVEDEFEVQPLTSADGHSRLVTDARVDNRDELAVALGWSPTESAARPDSAFVLAAYERWGEECASHLEGRFALVVWDERARRIFCATDVFGMRPLYYWRTAQEFVFATTLRGVMALPRVPCEIDEGTLAAFIARLPPADPTDTLYRGIRRIDGGHTLSVTATECRATRYWQPDPTRVLRLKSDGEYLEAFRAELVRAVDAVSRRSLGNVGLLLSGGLDSSMVGAVAGRLLADRGRRLQAIHAVPAGPNVTAGLRERDESHYVRRLAEYAPHLDVHFMAGQAEPAMPEEWDDYFSVHRVPFLNVPTRRGDTARVELQDQLGIGTMLSGGGGNFLVSLESVTSGYLSHLFVAGRWLRWARELRGHRRVYGSRGMDLVRATAVVPMTQAIRRQTNPYQREAVNLLAPELRRRTGIDERLRENAARLAALPWNFREVGRRALEHIAWHHRGAVPSHLVPGGRGGVMRAPLEDRRLNEFCLALPFDQQVRDGWDRRLVREAMRGWLPDEIRLRVTRGMDQPLGQERAGKLAQRLRGELERLGADPTLSRWLDLSILCQPAARPADSRTGEADARMLLAGVAMARFLEWHGAHGARRTAPKS